MYKAISPLFLSVVTWSTKYENTPTRHELKNLIHYLTFKPELNCFVSDVKKKKKQCNG